MPSWDQVVYRSTHHGGPADKDCLQNHSCWSGTTDTERNGPYNRRIGGSSKLD